MFLVYEMCFEKKVIPSPDIECIPFEDKVFEDYQEQYKKAYNAAFHPMREALGIRPYDWFSEGGAVLKENSDIFLLINDGEFIGSVGCYGNEVDDLFVGEGYHGKGYGRKLLIWAMNSIINKGNDKIVLHVAEWNEKAVQMYLNEGFVIVRKEEMQHDL